MLRLLAKAGIASVTVSGIIFTNDSLTIIPSTRKDKKNSFEEKIKEISSSSDIEIYEKMHGCTFLYSNSFRNKEVYRIETFLEKDSNESKRRSALDAANKYKNKCKDNKIVTFFYDSDNQSFHVCGPNIENKPDKSTGLCK